MTATKKTEATELDTKPAAQVEAENDDERVLEFRDLKLTVPADIDDWPTETRKNFSLGRGMVALEILLGRDQWAIFNAHFPKYRDYEELLSLVASEFGFTTPGN